MDRVDIINHLIEVCGYRKYLEIGVDRGECIRRVNAADKTGVDPNQLCPEVTHNMTSDQFFAENSDTFDLVFIDGLHTRAQAYKDLMNAKKVLNKGGVIVMHDCSPDEEFLQVVPRMHVAWTGDVWKAIYDFRATDPSGWLATVDTDYGVAVHIPDGCNNMGGFVPKQASDVEWADLVKNRWQWLNLVTCDTFLEILPTLSRQ